MLTCERGEEKRRKRRWRRLLFVVIFFSRWFSRDTLLMYMRGVGFYFNLVRSHKTQITHKLNNNFSLEFMENQEWKNSQTKCTTRLKILIFFFSWKNQSNYCYLNICSSLIKIGGACIFCVYLFFPRIDNFHNAHIYTSRSLTIMVLQYNNCTYRYEILSFYVFILNFYKNFPVFKVLYIFFTHSRYFMNIIYFRLNLNL